MTIQSIRYQNLKILLADAANSQAELARRAGTHPAYISQILNGTPLPSGKPRSVGDRLARSLETAFDKQHGWMDETHPQHHVSENHPEYRTKRQTLVELAKTLEESQLDKAIRQLTNLMDTR
ncbi:helix-turn-helix transcriptional regulator [Porticoccaceae bacterium LTM1]|nr:helix-turn-helix transcriptional regulator [Porticoccaceae bacterium LTM1]